MPTVKFPEAVDGLGDAGLHESHGGPQTLLIIIRDQMIRVNVSGLCIFMPQCVIKHVTSMLGVISLDC